MKIPLICSLIFLGISFPSFIQGKNVKGCVQHPTPAPSIYPTPEPQPSLTTKPTERPTNGSKSITIVSYNDVYILEQVMTNGYGVGGASRASKYIKDVLKTDPNTLVLFAGDTMSPSLWSTIFKGIQMIDAHNIMGCDYACLGNHEFDFTLEDFFNASKRSNFTWLNANCYETSTKKLLRETIPNAITEINGLKVGLFGVMYDMKDPATGVYWTDPIEAAKNQTKELKERGAEFIIALTHQTWEEDNVFSSEVPDLDLILGGHDHRAMMQTEFGTPYLKADMDFKSLWLTHAQYFPPKSKKKKHFVSMKNEKIPITEDMPVDESMEKIIKTYKTIVDKKYDEVIGSSCQALDLRQDTVRGNESAVGNFIADSFLTAYRHPADIAMMNGGGIRTNKIWEKGQLKFGDILSWCPFGNKILHVKLNGKTLRNFLEAAMSQSCGGNRAFRENGDFAHVSGLKYHFDCEKASHGNVIFMKKLTLDGTYLDIEDEDELIFALPNYSYNRFKTIFTKGNAILTLTDKDAKTIDLAIQAAVKELKQICPKKQDRIVLTFSSSSNA